MTDNCFEKLRTLSANLDNGIAKLQESWKMPNLLLFKNNEEDQIAARKLVENLRNELKLLKETLEESKTAVACLRESQMEFIEESTKTIDDLKEEVNNIKILFQDNGYVEESIESDISNLNSQVELLSINNSNTVQEISARDSGSQFETLETRSSSNTTTSDTNNRLFNNLKTSSLLNDRPKELIYSPYHYRNMKK